MSTDATAPMAEALRRLIGQAAGVRVSTSAAALAERKRRRRTDPVEEVGVAGTAELLAVTTLRGGELMAWMEWPGLWLELVAADGSAAATLGHLHPGWLRWDQFGDAELADGESFERWLATWAPNVARRAGT